jgi:hypothetical protein
MEQNNYHRTGRDPVVEPWGLLVGALVILVFALPALVLGLILARLTRQHTWSLPVSLGLSCLAIGLTWLLLLHGLEPLMQTQLSEIVREARAHQADVLQWDAARLWATTWPVWLRTLVLVPVVAAAHALSTRAHSIGPASLHIRESHRQQAVTRAQAQATRRLRRKQRRLPAAVRGQMVIGISIEDEANA